MPPILHYAQPHTDRQLPCAAYALQGDPLAAGRVIHFHEAQQGFVTGSSVSVGANLLIEDFPWVELGIVEAGELRLQGEGFDLQLSAGDCFVVPRGVSVRWHHRGQLRRLFMAFPGLEACAEMPKQPIRIDLTQPLAPCNPPAASVLLTATPKAWSETLFSVANLRIGLWQCEGYARRQVEPSYSELMFILDGAVTLTAEQGDSYVVRAGETVVVPRGATNAWVSDGVVRKVFCILS
ncbi:cupin domain-containing protein [Pseudomonas sp. NPDC090202]|uniref:cupin domain-containing protein n=1 Tax=unclassified Pseudomonas TaxID=196821 RepID=UPI00380D8ED4